jgi:hypothetical protein
MAEPMKRQRRVLEELYRIAGSSHILVAPSLRGPRRHQSLIVATVWADSGGEPCRMV